jgi:L-fuconolactonase
MIDTHAHLWWRGDGHRVLIRERVAQLDADFGFDVLAPELSRAGVEQVVLVSAAQSFTETRRLLEAAGRHAAQVLGVIGFLDLEGDDFERELDAAAAHAQLVGLRLPLVVHDDAQWIRRQRVGRALDALATRSLVAQVLARPEHLAACADVLAGRPTLKCVIDHAGNPGPDLRTDTLWRDGLADLAQRTAAWCKVGEFSPAPGRPADATRCGAVLDHVLACFGPGRVVYGSNWPVSALVQDSAEALGQLRRTARDLGLDADGLARSMTDNALSLHTRPLGADRTG